MKPRFEGLKRSSETCLGLQIIQRIVYAVLVKCVTAGTANGLGTLWAPVWLRNLLTNFLLHIGGIHSGEAACPTCPSPTQTLRNLQNVSAGVKSTPSAVLG